MTAQPMLQGTSQGTPKGAWKITFLLFLFMLVNFADKIVVGLAGVPIMADLKLTPEQFGLLGSSFFFLFSISAIVVGFIVNKVPTRWVLLTLAVIWALAKDLPSRSQPTPSTNGSPTRSARCRPRSCRKARPSASSWPCRR